MQNFTNFLMKSALLLSLVMALSGLQAQTVTVVKDGTTLGPFALVPAAFGTPFQRCTSASAEAATGVSVTGTTLACDSVVTNLTGKIAIIDRGVCEFSIKCLNAQRAGADYIIVVNNSPAAPITMGVGSVGTQVTVPCFMVSQANGAILKANVEGGIYTIDNSPTAKFDTTDVVLWGANGEGGFGGGLNDWTANPISAGIGSLDSARWVWSSGSSSAQGSVINSPTSCDGAALFDAFALQDLTANPPYPDFTTELISPVIDASSFVGSQLKFYQYYIRLNGSAFLSYSLDGGETYSNPILVTTENVLTAQQNNVIGTEIKRINLPQIDGQSSVRIKFTFDGDFYFWIIDDVQIIQREANNLSANSFFAVPINAVTPISQVEPIIFQIDVENIGAVAQQNVNINVTIFDVTIPGNPVRDTVFTANLAAATIAPDSLFENIPFSATFTPTKVGNYLGVYTVTSDAEDFDFSDNQRTFTFSVSDSTFSKEFRATSLNRPSNANWGQNEPRSWAYGNYYYVTDGNYFATSTSFIIGGSAENKGLDLAAILYKWTDTNQNGNAEPEEREFVGFAPYTIQGTETGNTLVTVPLLDLDDEPVKLEDNTAYIMMLEYQVDRVDAPIVNFGFSNLIDYNSAVFTSQIIGNPRYAAMLGIAGNLSDATYGSVGFGRGTVPVVRLNIQQAVNTKNLTLAENSVQVFPNPTSDYVIVDLNLEQSAKEVSILIFDITGKVVSSRKYQNLTKEKLELSVNELANGVYFLNVFTEAGRKTQKLVIQR